MAYPAKEQFHDNIIDYIKANAESKIISRGKSYFLAKRPIDKTFKQQANKNLIEVSGTVNYLVSIFLSKTSKYEIRNSSCNCPYNFGGICKHEVAALLWLEENEHLIDFSYLNGEKSKIKKRTSSEPFSIQGFAKLNHESFDRYLGYPTFRNNDETITAFEIKETKLNEFFITISFEGSFFSIMEESYNLEIKVKERDLEISCDCDSSVKNICYHAYEFLGMMIEQNALPNFQMPSEEMLHQKGQELMEGFGFDNKQSWRNYFEVRFDRFQRVMAPKKAYSDLISPMAYKFENAEKVHISDAEKELAELNSLAEKKEYDLGFAFHFNQSVGGVSFNPVIAQTSAKGEKMKIKFKNFEPYHKKNVFLKKNDQELLSFGEDLSDVLNETEELQLINKVAPSLQEHPYLFLNKNEFSVYFRKNDLLPIKFQANCPVVDYSLHEKGEFIEIKTMVEHCGKKIRAAHKSLNFLHDNFVQIEDVLYFIHSYQEINHLYTAISLDGKRVHKTKFSELFDNYLKNVFKKYKVDLQQLKSYSHLEKLLNPLQKELYLSEVGGFVLLRPFIRYENDLLMNVLAEKSDWQMEGNNLLEIRQDEKIVEEFKLVIKDLHPDFEEQLRTDYLYISYDKLLHNKAFSSFFRKLSENNIKVFGLKNLKGLKVNPYPGKVKYQIKSGIDWFEVDASISFGDTKIGIEDLKKRFMPGNEYIELSDGSKGIIPAEWLQKLEQVFRHGEMKKGKLLVSNKKFSLIDRLFDELDDVETLAYIEDKKQKLLNFDGLKNHPIPKGIKAKLRHYQEDGFQWLCFLEEFQWGGILADDMGLGKTLQVITFFKYLIKKDKTNNLVVVPTSLLYNWQNELEKFAPSLKVYFYYGPQRDKNTKLFDKYDLVITSYGHMLSDIETLKDYNFNYVVLDESQAIKNPASKRFKAARLLKANNRIAMTGTPIENNTFDLYAQLSFLNPGFLGSAKGFKNDFAKAIDSERNVEKAEELQKLIKPFVLRRTKDQVAKELPDKTEEILYCEMGASQRKVYDAYRNTYQKKLSHKIEEEGLNKSRFTVLEGLMKLRQICDSPNILAGDEKYKGESVKIDLLLEHIKEKTGKHKILIFSQFTRMLKQIEMKIGEEGINYEYLDGKSTTKKRAKSVDNFQNNIDCRVFLISLKAGGTGLNLMAADYVYIVDPWWNPAVENQAIDRCYRIGQKKNVIAYRLICKNTVEEKIVELQNKKKTIAGDIITTDENVIKKMGKEELIGLFS